MGTFYDFMLFAEEGPEQKYDSKAKVYDFDCVTKRVAEVMSMEIDQVTAI